MPLRTREPRHAAPRARRTGTEQCGGARFGVRAPGQVGWRRMLALEASLSDDVRRRIHGRRSSPPAPPAGSHEAAALG
jgi:hypothetical protein